MEEKTEQILRGALLEFLEYGYHGTTMEKIAKSAGVSKQTLYSYFRDKEGLFYSLVSDFAARKFKLVWSEPLEGKPELVLKNLANRIIKEINEPLYLNFIHLIFTEVKNYPEIAQLCFKNLVKPAINLLTKYLKDSPDLSLADPEAVAHIFVNSIIHYILTQEKLQAKKIIPLEKERLIDNLILLIVNNKV